MSFSFTMNTFLYYPQDSLHGVIVSRFHHVHSLDYAATLFDLCLEYAKEKFSEFPLYILVAGTLLITLLQAIELLHDQ